MANLAAGAGLTVELASLKVEIEPSGAAVAARNMSTCVERMQPPAWSRAIDGLFERWFLPRDW